MNIFGGKSILWVIFWDHHKKTGLCLGVIFMHFGSFLNVKVPNERYFLGLVKFQIFFGMLEMTDIFFGGGGGRGGGGGEVND